MSKLDELRKKLQQLENKGKPKRGSDETFAFWDIPADTSARVRFLPDGNSDNPFFWVERQQINLSFPGIKGHDEHKEITIKVPCAAMHGISCPILTEVKPWWNDESLKEMASKYWCKRSYFFQGFVQESQLSEEKLPENPIRKFVIGPQLFKIIKSSLLDPDFDNIPTDYLTGSDFTIVKTGKGQWPDYSTSKWARKETSLTTEQQDAISQYGLTDLATWLPPKPDSETLGIIYEMFEASVNGELYDPARFAKYFKPYGFDYAGETHTSAPAPAPRPAAAPAAPRSAEPVVDDGDENDSVDDSAVSQPKLASTGKSANEILDIIRKRAAG
jgi:hypothetical protein